MAQFEHNSDKFGYLNLETLEGVQQGLKQLGFDPGKVDGRDGPNTRDAVRKFQAHATIKIDGRQVTSTIRSIVSLSGNRM